MWGIYHGEGSRPLKDSRKAADAPTRTEWRVFGFLGRMELPRQPRNSPSPALQWPQSPTGNLPGRPSARSDAAQRAAADDQGSPVRGYCFSRQSRAPQSPSSQFRQP